MKKLQLWVNKDELEWFDYENISDLKDELDKRLISIGDRASIGDGASIGYGASIGDGARIKTLFITGSRNTISFYGIDVIHIGCIKKTIEEWKDQYVSIGKENDYTEDQIKEYKAYIDICSSLQETMKPIDNHDN